ERVRRIALRLPDDGSVVLAVPREAEPPLTGSDWARRLLRRRTGSGRPCRPGRERLEQGGHVPDQRLARGRVQLGEDPREPTSPALLDGADDLAPPVGDLEDHLAPVGGMLAPADQPTPHEPVDELRRCGTADDELFREDAR